MSRLLVVAGLLALGCANKKTQESMTPTPPPPAPQEATMVDADTEVDVEVGMPMDPTLALLNTRWELRSINGTEVQVEPNSRPVFFRVDAGSPPDLIGFAGCNRFYGTALSATETTVSFGTIGMTRMACPSLSSDCLLYTSPSPRDQRGSRMPSSA